MIRSNISNRLDTITMRKKFQAFSLTEMAVVLVIISMLTGGVFAGVKFIQASRVKSVINEMTMYKGVIDTFRLAYDYFPGDFPNAYPLWKTAGSCTNNYINSVAGGCNGNGNGQINYPGESPLAWMHLNLAKLVQGSFNLTNAVALGKIGNYVFTTQGANFYVNYPGGTVVTLILSGNLIYPDPVNNFVANVLTPTEAYLIDQRIDDGIASKGLIYGWPWASGTCVYQLGTENTTKTVVVAINSGVDAAYALDQKSKSCALSYVLR